MSGHELTVLLVEDSPAEAGRVSSLFSETSPRRIDLRAVKSLTEAQEFLANHRLDAILLDWFLRDHQGMDSLRELQFVAPRTPVLILSGRDDDELAVEALRAGAQDILIRERLTTQILEQAIRFAVERKRTEVELRKTEEMYRALIESLPVSVFRKDEQGRFVFANQRFCEVMDRRLEELVGQTDHAFYPAELADKYRQDDLMVMAENRAFEDIEDHSTPAGRKLHVQVMKAPATDVDGHVVGTQSMFWDVTPRVEAEEALQRSNSRFRKLFDANIIGIILADLSGRLLEANDAFLALVDYSREDLASGTLRWDNITPPEHASADERAIVSLRETGICPAWEKEYLRRDGRHVPVLVGVSMLDDSLSECICFVIDMTEQKKAQEQLRRAKEEADAANRAKSLFLANMSHEIRTPMNAIIGMTDLVLQSPLTNPQRDNLSVVSEAADSLLSLINHILDFSKIEAGKLELDTVEFSLRTLVSGTLKTLSLTAHRKGLELVGDIRSDVPDRVIGDPVRLRQVLLNLLGNGIKFTESGEVSLHVSLASRGETTAEFQFEVRDTGIGIPADRQQAIFEAFEQVDTSINRKYGGTGLGLAISGNLAHLMGGRIWLTSEPGQGSVFFVTCRLALASWTGLAVARSPSPLDGRRILIVDDNSTSRRQLSDLTTCWGLKPIAVSSAKEAIGLLENVAAANQAFTFSLIDAQMPGIDGFELAATIRCGLAERAGQMLLMLSSPNRSAELARCDQFELSASIPKPINESELLDTLTALQIGAIGSDITMSKDRSIELARQPLSILLVEDALFNQKLAVTLLERRGHHVTIANNGREAVEATLRQSFDRILMDVQMPEMDGLEATHILREREVRTGLHVPIVAMTAQALAGDRDRCLSAGMDDYLTKPIRADLLYETLERDFPNAVFPKDHARRKSAESRQAATRAAAVPRGLVPSPQPARNGKRPPQGRIDWNQALNTVGGDAKLLREVVGCCLEDFPKWLDQMDEALQRLDPPLFRRAAHSIRGALRTFPVASLEKPVEDLELLGQAGNLLAAGPLLETLRPDLRSCWAELQEYFATT